MVGVSGIRQAYLSKYASFRATWDRISRFHLLGSPLACAAAQAVRREVIDNDLLSAPPCTDKPSEPPSTAGNTRPSPKFVEKAFFWALASVAAFDAPEGTPASIYLSKELAKSALSPLLLDLIPSASCHRSRFQRRKFTRLSGFSSTLSIGLAMVGWIFFCFP